MNAGHKASLTEQQIEGVAKSALDLASGYPVLPLSEALLELVFEGTRAAMDGGNFDLKAERRLQVSVGELLRLPPTVTGWVRSTFSGSVALDRVFVAVRRLARSSGREGLTAIVAEPSIDLSQLLLSERSDVRVVGVPRRADSSDSQADLLIMSLEAEFRRTPKRQMFVILDSPSNPLGLVADTGDLDRLAVACGRFGAVLVVDHCFLLAGVHAPLVLPSVFGISGEVCDWVGIWDTGKTIDVGGDKLGFIVPGNARTAKAVDEALAVIQTGPARRAIEVFSRLLGAPELTDYLVEAGRICRVNLAELQSRMPDDTVVPTPSSGAFGCVYVPGFEEGSDELRLAWMTAGVSVVSGRTFFSTIGEGEPFLRVSLLRDPIFFRSAIKRLRSRSSAVCSGSQVRAAVWNADQRLAF